MDLSTVHGGPTPSSLANNEMTAADWWFTVLDQRSFMIDDVRWTIQVSGIHLDGFHTWIQIQLGEDSESSLLLRLTPRAGLQDAIDIVRAEIAQRTSSGSAGADSPELGDCHDVVIRGLSVCAPERLG